MDTTLTMHPEMETLRPRIEAALAQIRPFLQSDNGDVRLVGVTPEWEVQVELLGACVTCRMSTMTMKAGVEEAIKAAVPEVRTVVAV